MIKFCRSRRVLSTRPWWITPSLTCRIFHILLSLIYNCYTSYSNSEMIKSKTFVSHSFAAQLHLTYVHFSQSSEFSSFIHFQIGQQIFYIQIYGLSRSLRNINGLIIASEEFQSARYNTFRPNLRDTGPSR